MIEQMREIACFTVLIYGSLQLGSLIYCTLSVKLHSKITYKLNGNHKRSPKWCFNSWLLDWALCLVELIPSRPSPLNIIFSSPCFVPFIILFDVVDVWIGDWWMGGLMLWSVRIGLVKVDRFDRWMVDWWLLTGWLDPRIPTRSTLGEVGGLPNARNVA